MATQRVHFEMYWAAGAPMHQPGADVPIPPNWVVNIRIKQSSDITWQNTQGYRDKADAMRAIRSLVERLADMHFEEATVRGRIKITGPGKKPS